MTISPLFWVAGLLWWLDDHSGSAPPCHHGPVAQGSEVTARGTSPAPAQPVVISDIRRLFWPCPAGRGRVFGWLGSNLGCGRAVIILGKVAPQDVLRLCFLERAARLLRALADPALTAS